VPPRSSSCRAAHRLRSDDQAHAEAYPPKGNYQISAKLLRDQITSGARTVLLVLLAASALVFIIACSNVANLILTRTVRREGELATRAAARRKHWRAAPHAAGRKPSALRSWRRSRYMERAAARDHPGALRLALLGPWRST